LDDTQRQVARLFSGVRHTPTSIAPNFAKFGSPYDSSQLAHQYEIVAIKETFQIHVIWALPSLLEHYLSKPEHYIGHLLGHEGKGSLFSLLKQRGNHSFVSSSFYLSIYLICHSNTMTNMIMNRLGNIIISRYRTRWITDQYSIYIIWCISSFNRRRI
jgi:hypothetical protein